MKKIITYLIFLFSFLACQAAYGINDTWQTVPNEQAPSKQLLVFQPAHYLVYSFNETELRIQMFGLSENPGEGMVVSLPLPDGSFRDFRIWQAPMLPGNLAAKYPDIKTFTGVATDDSRVTAKIDFTIYGFHALIFDGDNTAFIDPYDLLHDGYYIVHYQRDEVRNINQRMKCNVNEKIPPHGITRNVQKTISNPTVARTGSGWTYRSYRLALSADHQYCQAATGLGSPTIAQALSCMTTTMNRVNGIYEREFSIHLNFCNVEDSLIWPVNTGSINGADPFSADNTNGLACWAVNQTQCDTRVGTDNYDIGHVFTTGGGGISEVGVVCEAGAKAMSCTGLPYPVGDGFDIDYVTHEMGHEFGSKHTFNNNMDGSCSGNAVAEFAYEPGSGATVMDYAGICSPDDLQPNSCPYFSASSLVQIYTVLTGSESTCAIKTPTNNKLVNVPGFTAAYTIPYKTPFELNGPLAIDSVADTATTYCWAQWNLGDFGQELVNTFLYGPIFRSFQPAYTPLRIFPQQSMVMAGVLTNAGTEGAEGEKAPDTARSLTFKLVFRDILNGNGCFLFPDDSVLLTAVATPTYKGFKVTSQNSSGIGYVGGSTQTITWDVAGTNSAPVNATNVDIYLSKDNGTTWLYHIGTFPNTGTASVTIPNPASITGSARIKVKGSGNVFFNVNSTAFTVTNNPVLPVSESIENHTNTLGNEIKIYPIPASVTIHISTGTHNLVQATIYNTIGQTTWQGQVNGFIDIPLNNWVKGVYYIRFVMPENGEQVVRVFIVE